MLAFVDRRTREPGSSDELKAAEVSLAAPAHGSFLTALHLAPVVSGCFSDSALVSAMKLGRTKCTALVTKALGPAFRDELLKDMTASRAEMITHAYVRYVDDRTCAVVSTTDIKDFAPKDTEDFPVTPLLPPKGKRETRKAEILNIIKRKKSALANDADEPVRKKLRAAEDTIAELERKLEKKEEIAELAALNKGLQRAVIARAGCQNSAGSVDPNRKAAKRLPLREGASGGDLGAINLLNRSLFGKPALASQVAPGKTHLTPKKVEVLRDCYMERLKRKGTLPGSELFDLAVKNVNGYIIQKLADNEKMAKRYAE
ncbi:hypothetical protein HPB48_007848 [Haemaphysalis longicornis]|uniref:BEN domain-containing protein n=1 Tax=Haemaphysalis longicornis TaxID=44386 RepID=A0A9J6FWM1_HAELO|nr:hypothetical protein HPB48_007848 [Haemaphysalis longicornis]